MTSIELKHQARLQEWAGAIRDCRSSGLSVRQWCRERGTTPTTYYRWERELLSVASTAKALSETPAVAFAELPVPKQVCCNTTERSATLRIGNASLDIYPSCDTEQMKKLVELCSPLTGVTSDSWDTPAGHRIYDACRGSSVSLVCRGSGASIVSSTSSWPLPT